MTITETPLRMEPVTADPFLDGLEPARTAPVRRRADQPRRTRAARPRPAARRTQRPAPR